MEIKGKLHKDYLDEANVIISPTPYPPTHGEVSVFIKNAKYPFDWNAKYYAVTMSSAVNMVNCNGCNGVGKIVLMSKETHPCPVCNGKGEMGKTVRTHRVREYRLGMFVCSQQEAYALFCDTRGGDYHRAKINSNHFADMMIDDTGTDYEYGDPRYLYDNREEAQAEADRLNGGRVGNNDN